jgi:thiamine biosynthesis lipoprotein ApbE
VNVAVRSPQTRSAVTRASWQALGTTVVLQVRDADALHSARAAVEGELAAIDVACSRFRADSELSRVNARSGRATHVGPLLLEALEVAVRAADLSDGDVDPTVGRALELAGYDRDWMALEPVAGEPEPPLRISARVRSGWREIALDRARGSVRLPPGIVLDLGATAKAWAADRAAAVAERVGGCGALVALGGDIATCGDAPPDGWRIRVTDDHRDGPSAPGQTVSIRSGGMATSSTAVRRWSHRGHTMHHIIDPRTGAPTRDTWRTVSVAGASCTDANIAATAAIVRGEAAEAWLEDLAMPARLLGEDGRVRALAGWPAEPAGARQALCVGAAAAEQRSLR